MPETCFLKCMYNIDLMFQDLSVRNCSTINVLFKGISCLFLRTTCLFQLTEKRTFSPVYYDYGTGGNTALCFSDLHLSINVVITNLTHNIFIL
jgi:hypothetical protein